MFALLWERSITTLHVAILTPYLDLAGGDLIWPDEK
jgi:hypothetical protein